MVAEREPPQGAVVRRRPSWSLRTIVENVAGQPISAFQGPGPPSAILSRPERTATFAPGRDAALGNPSEEEPALDPVDSVYPPLVGPLGREYHGPEREHHPETIERHRPRSGIRGPSTRPERLYLHYLLLHVDRLSDNALRYLGQAVEEERAHRAQERNLAAPAPATAPPPPSARGPARLSSRAETQPPRALL